MAMSRKYVDGNYEWEGANYKVNKNVRGRFNAKSTKAKQRGKWLNFLKNIFNLSFIYKFFEKRNEDSSNEILIKCDKEEEVVNSRAYKILVLLGLFFTSITGISFGAGPYSAFLALQSILGPSAYLNMFCNFFILPSVVSGSLLWTVTYVSPIKKAIKNYLMLKKSPDAYRVYMHIETFLNQYSWENKNGTKLEKLKALEKNMDKFVQARKLKDFFDFYKIDIKHFGSHATKGDKPIEDRVRFSIQTKIAVHTLISLKKLIGEIESSQVGCDNSISISNEHDVEQSDELTNHNFHKKELKSNYIEDFLAGFKKGEYTIDQKNLLEEEDQSIVDIYRGYYNKFNTDKKTSRINKRKEFIINILATINFTFINSTGVALCFIGLIDLFFAPASGVFAATFLPYLIFATVIAGISGMLCAAFLTSNSFKGAVNSFLSDFESLNPLTKVYNELKEKNMINRNKNGDKVFKVFSQYPRINALMAYGSAMGIALLNYTAGVQSVILLFNFSLLLTPKILLSSKIALGANFLQKSFGVMCCIITVFMSGSLLMMAGKEPLKEDDMMKNKSLFYKFSYWSITGLNFLAQVFTTNINVFSPHGLPSLIKSLPRFLASPTLVVFGVLINAGLLNLGKLLADSTDELLQSADELFSSNIPAIVSKIKERSIICIIVFAMTYLVLKVPFAISLSASVLIYCLDRFIINCDYSKLNLYDSPSNVSQHNNAQLLPKSTTSNRFASTQESKADSELETPSDKVNNESEEHLNSGDEEGTYKALNNA